ncbi:hypothetical protein JCM1841_005104 [Sporobolomyces salmonicolor]
MSTQPAASTRLEVFQASLTVERQWVKEVVRAVLGMILFHRVCGTLRPAEVEVLGVSFPVPAEPEVEELLMAKTEAFTRVLLDGRSSGEARSGKVMIALYPVPLPPPTSRPSRQRPSTLSSSSARPSSPAATTFATSSSPSRLPTTTRRQSLAAHAPAAVTSALGWFSASARAALSGGEVGGGDQEEGALSEQEEELRAARDMRDVGKGPWEGWQIEIEVVRDGRRGVGAEERLRSQLNDFLLRSLSFVMNKTSHVPPITTSELMPYGVLILLDPSTPPFAVPKAVISEVKGFPALHKTLVGGGGGGGAAKAASYNPSAATPSPPPAKAHPFATMATAQQAYSVDRSKQNKGADPYQYQVGFGNSFASEAIPDVLPVGQNSPQKVKFGLYAEQVTATAFVAPRHQNQKLWLYRMRPSVAHQGFVRIPENPDMCSEFSPLNPKVSVSPTQIAWRPFPLPPSSQKVDFVEGLKTIAGTGSPMEKTGLAIHMYLANTSMDKKAFINNDGDMLIVPQQGRLDIQTELGHLMVAPGEICVIQRGLRFKVNLPDGPSRGFIQEIFGTHYKLPELGPLGANGLANARDFEHPVASFEVDQSGWLIVYKLMGTMWACSQEHSPFDVVAWHGNYVPYKYDLSRFCVVGSVSFDHIDPSIFCVLTVDSNEPGTPLADLLVFSPRWDVATHTFRPPYFHRNAASEFMAAIFGGYEGRSDDFLPGGASYECGFTPHGVSHEVFKEASEIEQSQPQFISQGTVAVMFESSRQFTLTDYAVNRSGTIHYHEPKMWDPLVSEFVERLDEVNEHLAKHGLPPISKGNATAGNQGLARRTVEGESAMEGSSH